MGLGKTPTMLAHLAGTRERCPALVIAPPAVVGNWAAEAARFTPDMRVVVHHGATRATAKQLAATIAKADVVIRSEEHTSEPQALTRPSYGVFWLQKTTIYENPPSESHTQ